MGFFSKIKEGLTKTRKAMAETLGNVFSGFSNLDDDFYDELEECLILADLGVETAGRAVESLRRRVKEEKIREPEEAKAALKDILVEMLDVGDTRLRLDTQPSVVLVIGEDHHHRKAGQAAGGPGETGADVRRRYLPGRRCRSAGDLGRAHRRGHCPPARGGGPCRRGL